MGSENYIENIVYICRLISDSDLDIWTGLQEIIIDDEIIEDNVKTAIFSILEDKKGTTSRSPTLFGRIVEQTINDLQTKTWNDLGFSDRLLPSLNIELRNYLFGKLVQYLMVNLQEVKNNIATIEESGGLIPSVEIEEEESEYGYEYGYGY